jgi:hypothetical protein
MIVEKVSLAFLFDVFMFLRTPEVSKQVSAPNSFLIYNSVSFLITNVFITILTCLPGLYLPELC